MYSFDNNNLAKYDTIQEDVADMYDVEDVMIEDDEDIFGFSKAIEIDHLTDEQVDEIFNMFGDK